MSSPAIPSPSPPPQPISTPKKKATYTWTTSGGRVTGNDDTATVATAGLAPGDYTVTGHVSEGITPRRESQLHRQLPRPRLRAANHRLLGQSQHCDAGRSLHDHFGRQQPAEPAPYLLLFVLCRPDPWIASTATLNTSRRSRAAPITVTCNVVDDLGKQATATTSVTISTPPPPHVPPEARSLCSVSFERDTKRPVRVDNEAKGCLDEIALTLNRDILGQAGDCRQAFCR